MGKLTALIIYVDDMIVTSDDKEEISSLKDYLATEFEMKDLGGLKYFLGIEVARSKPGIFLSQRKYVLDLPDIAYAVSVVSQFMYSSSDTHMDVVECILRYLKSASGRGIMFSKNGHCRIEGYTDVDWAQNITDRWSTSGYFTFVGGNLATWLSKKKKKVVALSSVEAEYRGMAKGVCEL
ncbi:unnamed protein product [Malus baccata var. baccata]